MTRRVDGKIKGKTTGDMSALLHPAMKRPWSKQESPIWPRARRPVEAIGPGGRSLESPKRFDPLFTERGHPLGLSFAGHLTVPRRGRGGVDAGHVVHQRGQVGRGWGRSVDLPPLGPAGRPGSHAGRSSMPSIWTVWPVPGTRSCCNQSSCRRPNWRSRRISRDCLPCPSLSTGSMSPSDSSSSTASPWSPGKAFRRPTS